jgi:hypothetical protein
MAFHRSEISCYLTRYYKSEIYKIGLDPCAWLRNGVDDFNTNIMDVVHQGVYQRWMKACRLVNFAKTS